MSFRDFVGHDDDGNVRFLALNGPPEETSSALVNLGFAARHTTAVNRECPACCAPMRTPNRAERRLAARTGRILRAEVDHETWCPAVADEVVAVAEGGPSW